jgi:hypothetical protein
MARFIPETHSKKLPGRALAPVAPATIFDALAEGGMGSGVTRFLLFPVRQSQAAAVVNSLFSSEQVSDKVRP